MLESIDEDHAKKFEEALNAKDAADAAKLEEACNMIKTKADKENAILKESVDALKKERDEKLDILAESVNRYINYALQTNIPTKALISEAKYNATQKALEKITSILKINNIIQESKDGIFKEYEDRIAKIKKETNDLMLENVNLKNNLNKKEAKLLLESKLQKSTPSEAAFLRSYFKNADNTKVIEEQIEDARNAFKRLHEEKRKELVEKNNKNSNRESIVNESKNEVKKEIEKKREVRVEPPAQTDNSFTSIYSEMLKLR